jgi:hypothetical protein
VIWLIGAHGARAASIGLCAIAPTDTRGATFTRHAQHGRRIEPKRTCTVRKDNGDLGASRPPEDFRMRELKWLEPGYRAQRACMAEGDPWESMNR